jgi:hypothetical protein
MPKFSVELLDMRKRQVLLAKSGQYIEAEKLKRKADMLEVIEIDVINHYHLYHTLYACMHTGMLN